MSRLRPILARLLAGLLLMQWGGAPAHCLMLAALQADPGSVLCLAPDGTLGHPAAPDSRQQSPDHVCPACSTLGHAALTPDVPVLSQTITWFVFPRVLELPAGAGLVRVATPLQPRAPPLSV
jgi:hypothetical protein